MPSAARASSLRRWWVVVAGWVMIDFASPRLLEIVTSSSALRNRNAAACPPLSSSDSIVPGRVICALRKRVLGVGGEAGKITRDSAACPSSASAMACALSACARQRSSTCSSDFSITQALNGLIAPPVCFM
jgi:hypothetical protein